MQASFRMQTSCMAPCSHRPSMHRPAPLRAHLLKSFFGSSPTLSSSRSTFAGSLLSIGNQQRSSGRRSLVVEANSKTGIGLTKRGTRRARTRTSGFRARSQTPSGRAVLKARRKKGRHTLCPASNYRK